MEPINHRLATHVLRGDDDQVVDLPCVVLANAGQSGEKPEPVGYASFWQPSADEIAMIVAGKPICLELFAHQHPAVRISVDGDPDIAWMHLELKYPHTLN